MAYETITVTRADIKAGNRRNPNCRNCPIALAVQRMHPDWAVGSTKLFYYSSMRNVTALPKKAQQFIKMFELGAKVKPFSFRISVKRTTKQKGNHEGER